MLIALIALSRKFVILDNEAGPGRIAALAAAALTLGIIYWLLRERDDNAPACSTDSHSHNPPYAGGGTETKSPTP